MTSSSRCSVCRNGAGTCFCPGCKAYFCDNDFKDHRGMLVNKLDELSVEKDDLQENIKTVTSHNLAYALLLSDIDEWQQNIIEKVKQTAEQARQHVLQMINLKREEIITQFQSMSEEVKQLIDTKGVVEHDLERLKKRIDQLNEDLEELSHPSTIELNVKQTEQIDWNRLIFIQERPAYAKMHIQSQSDEKQSTAAISSETKLECNGQACNKCRKCRSWYRDDTDEWHCRQGSSCNWSPYDDEYNDSFLNWYGHICRCDDNN